MQYVAFLRGINVGGNKKVPMAELRELCVSLGFTDVKTLLNSGNIVFECTGTTEQQLVSKIEDAIKRTFGFESKVIVRSMSHIGAIVEEDPFRETAIDSDTRLYVTFLRTSSENQLELPFQSDNGDFRILCGADREVFTLLNVKTARSVDAMKFIEQQYGKDVTTRNWNTILRIDSLSKQRTSA